MFHRITLALVALLILQGCNTFGAPDEFNAASEGENEDAGGTADSGEISDSGEIDSGMVTGPTLMPEETCPETPRHTALPDEGRLTGNPVSGISAAWTGRTGTSTVSVGYVTDDAAATVTLVDIPDSDGVNSVASTFTVRTDWALSGHESLDVDVMPAVMAADGPRLLSVSDPCETPDSYGIEGEISGNQREIPIPCTDPILPIAAEFVGGVSEFDSSDEWALSFVTAEVIEQQVYVAALADSERLGTDVLPSGPLAAEDFDLRGTTGELALVFNANAEAFVYYAPTGVIRQLEDPEGNPLTRLPIELDVVHLSRNRYAVAYTDGEEVVLARYDLELVSGDGPPFAFESVGVVERVALDGPSIGVALATFRSGVALLFFEEEASDHEWTIRPYRIDADVFTPYSCESDFSYSPIEMHSFDVVARRDGRDLVVQQANHFTAPAAVESEVNVEGFVFPNFF